PLERSDVLGYALIDDIRNQGIWKWIMWTGQLLTVGGKRAGQFVIGPYARLAGWNPVEGFRTQVGIQTHPEFNPRWYLQGWGAYGFLDKRFKYEAEVRCKLNLKPRLELTLRRTDGIE